MTKKQPRKKATSNNTAMFVSVMSLVQGCYKFGEHSFSTTSNSKATVQLVKDICRTFANNLIDYKTVDACFQQLGALWKEQRKQGESLDATCRTEILDFTRDYHRLARSDKANIIGFIHSLFFLAGDPELMPINPTPACRPPTNGVSNIYKGYRALTRWRFRR